jgi:hypothetical protein
MAATLSALLPLNVLSRSSSIAAIRAVSSFAHKFGDVGNAIFAV